MQKHGFGHRRFNGRKTDIIDDFVVIVAYISVAVN